MSEIAERQDLLVTCSPGAGRGAPACFVPAHASVEVDGNHLGVEPSTCDPAQPSDRDRYPALWGLLVHEVAHADHTLWRVPADAAKAVASAALLLEESRAEGVHLGRRPGDRYWIRAAARALILADFADAAMTRWDAAQAAGLLLARVDSGVLDEDEIAAVAAVVQKVLGRTRLTRLRRIWRRGQRTADDDGARMLELGRRWCKALGIAPDRSAPECSSRRSGPPTPLAEAVEKVVGVVATGCRPVSASTPNKTAARAAEREHRRRSATIAATVFPAGGAGRQQSQAPGQWLREPTPAEHTAARRLARALRAAGHRERVATSVTSPTPPGRLRMRQALAAEAQRAAGQMPVAEPFTRTVRHHVPWPPVRVGIVCDSSASMAAQARPVASAAWILARAAAHVPDARSATVVFAGGVHPLTHPGAVSKRVREFKAAGGTTAFSDAVDAVDAALDLSLPGAVRLLVIASDGELPPDHRLAGQQRVARLMKAGCGVLWLAQSASDTPLDGVHTVLLDSPADAADIIARAIVRVVAAAT
ncbi:MAG: hypothetical protein E6J41_05380 [Chloroflexi bacterium]|nr:MAG: hypothetical protein E6J41_05380 [Chloroflexota bacterium]